MSVALVAIKAKTRGKNTREVEYQGVGKFVTEKTEKRETVDGKEKIVKDKDGNPVMVDVQVLKTAGVVTDIKDALEIEKNDMQSLLDNWAIGYNLNAYKGVSDALSEYIDENWTEAQTASFRLTVNAFSKMPGQTIDSAAKFILEKMSPATM